MLTTRQAATKLNLTHSLVCRYIREGRLPAQKFGNAYMITEADLAKFASTPRKVGQPPKTIKPPK